ncbi:MULTISPECIES: 16S rRNA (cytidine(1402)-2'-O)-methyltransferase [Paenibacillus]|uniref:16S rRNA (cytidine(1402)-2'-O)-methyltransferase n=1 Tax=Paenibacillus TaxID=44249 RepID=UPI000954D6CE|nr:MULTISPECIES: 16S rRNA (cytidine(1402)-2'-O)-methyltransferase [Paenibacillus]ASS67665.1 16S rRNA (cytidine(1402)-2'-O)-methyltransferase [Paenibacillus sp. RUD330]SIR66181.1 16S rRNA (cytidine1402-2'-O)-methyltransferase [Paenibacillus sp. RU4X]SIR74087.1 16S rRNA (cytidine1402-2'-O)-methyltransferase [Paenibacillus sp. RU4T]
MNRQKSFEEHSCGTLYLVATPIGNLEDITMRAIRILKEVSLIAAEDTRQTRKLLSRFEIDGRLVSYHEHNKAASGPELIRLLEEGSSIALVSDAGMPAISDPGADLVKDAVERGIPVVPVPGANAALAALIISGLPTERFMFAGFPPRDKKSLENWLLGLKRLDSTLLFYESPHRVAKTLPAIRAVLGDRRMAMIRELTKKHEEAVRGTVSECEQWLEENEPLGEYCLVVEGADEDQAAEQGPPWWEGLSLEEHASKYEEQGEPRKEAIRKTAADRGLQKRDVYNELMRK